MSTLLSQRLKEKRKERGLTLAQVGERIDMSLSFLSDVETGKSFPSFYTLEKLAECYQTTVAVLCAEFDEQRYERLVRIRILEKILEEIQTELDSLRSAT